MVSVAFGLSAAHLYEVWTRKAIRFFLCAIYGSAVIPVTKKNIDIEIPDLGRSLVFFSTPRKDPLSRLIDRAFAYTRQSMSSGVCEAAAVAMRPRLLD